MSSYIRCQKCGRLMDVTGSNIKECECGWTYKKQPRRKAPGYGDYNPPNRPIFKSMMKE